MGINPSPQCSPFWRFPNWSNFFSNKVGSRQARNALGHRSINAPLEDVEEKICGLLRIEETNDYTIFDFPTKLIEETFLAKNTEIEGAVFLRLNGKDPNEALSKLVSSHWPDAKIRPASAKYEVSVEKVRAEKPTLPFAIARAMNRALLIELWAEKKGGKWHWRQRFASGSFLSGGGVEGAAEKAYGYCIAKSTSYWGE